MKVLVSLNAVPLRRSEEFEGLLFRKAVRPISLEDSVHEHTVDKDTLFLLANDAKGYGVVVLFGYSPWRFVINEKQYTRILELQSVPAYTPASVAKLIENMRKNEHLFRVYSPKTTGAGSTIFKLLLGMKDQSSDYAIRVYIDSTPYAHERPWVSAKFITLYNRTIEVPMSLKSALKLNPGRYSAEIVRNQADGSHVVLRWDDVNPITGNIGEYAWYPTQKSRAMVRRDGWHPDIKSTIQLD